MTRMYEHEAEDMYEEFLNESYEPVTICGYTYDAGRALRKLDPPAFTEGYLAWLDAEDITTDDDPLR